MTTLSIPDEYTIDVNGQSTLTFNQDGELRLENFSRSSSGRALTADNANTLTINNGQDFTGGVQIAGGVKLPHVAMTPAGTGTEFVKIDANGNLSKADFFDTIPLVPPNTPTDFVRIDPVTGKLYRQD